MLHSSHMSFINALFPCFCISRPKLNNSRSCFQKQFKIFYLLQDSLISVGFGLNALVQIHSGKGQKRQNDPPAPTPMEPVFSCSHLRDLVQGNGI